MSTRLYRSIKTSPFERINIAVNTTLTQIYVIICICCKDIGKWPICKNFISMVTSLKNTVHDHIQILIIIHGSRFVCCPHLHFGLVYLNYWKLITLCKKIVSTKGAAANYLAKSLMFRSELCRRAENPNILKLASTTDIFCGISINYLLAEHYLTSQQRANVNFCATESETHCASRR